MAKHAARKRRHLINGNASRKVAGARISYHYLILVDILGQKTDLAKLHLVPLDAPDTEAQLLPLVKATGETVKHFRSHFLSIVDPLRKSTGSVPSHLTKAQADFLRDFRKLNMRFMYFSDTVCVYDNVELFGLPILQGNRVMSLHYALLTTGAMLLMYMAVYNRTIRGGVAVSKAWPIWEQVNQQGQPVSSEVYGPALMFAHKCESECADWPRIILHSSVVDYLNEVIAERSESWACELSDLAANCLKLLKHDGTYYYLDYLGLEFRRAHEMTPGAVIDIRQLVSKSYIFAKKERNRFLSERNQILSPRYAKLVRYFESNQKNWPSEIIPDSPIDVKQPNAGAVGPAATEVVTRLYELLDEYNIPPPIDEPFDMRIDRIRALKLERSELWAQVAHIRIEEQQATVVLHNGSFSADAKITASSDPIVHINHIYGTEVEVVRP